MATNQSASMIAVDRTIETMTDELAKLVAIDQRGSLNPAQETRHAELCKQLREARDRRAVLVDRMDRLVTAARDSRNLTPGDARSANHDGPQHLRHVEPWAERSYYDSPTEVRDRALAALDEIHSPGFADSGVPCEPEDRARIDGLLRSEGDDSRNGTDLSEYVVAASRPAYHSAFTKAVRGQQAYWTDEEKQAVIELDATRIRDEARISRDSSDVWESRAALSTTGANGGFMIPFFLDPTIILSNGGALNPMRSVARVITIPTNVWHGVSSAGVTAEWTSEASEVTDASPTFTQPTITPIRADAYVQASFEVVADSNVASQIGMLFGDAKNRLEVAAHFLGTGSTQPEGIVTRLNVTTASKVAANTNGTFGPVDIFALAQQLPGRWQANASWATHYSFEYSIRQMANAATPLSSTFWVDLGGPNPSQLLGHPIYPNNGMMATPLSTATASTDNVLVIGDFAAGYAVVDRIGMEIVVNPLVLGSNRRPTGEIGWLAVWRTGADTLVSDAFRMLQV